MAKKNRKTKSTAPAIIDDQQTALGIYVFRGESVVLDQDVAALFNVETKRLNEQVTRNADKFGDDFAFRLTKAEFTELRSQNATSSDEWGGRRYPPRVFTEHGVVMAATILRSKEAISATRFVVRTFVVARQNTIAKRRGENTPPPDSIQLALPLAYEIRTQLMTRVNDAIGRVLDAIVDPAEESTVRDEARAIASEGIKFLKETLKSPGARNEKTLAEVRKLMAEAENIEVETAGKRTANKQLQLGLLAKQLRLVLQAQHFVETGNSEGLIQVLSDFERHS